ncbi:MAG TPA: hypothetical protein ENK91_05770, partial [Bacteroidetes bacterium]|nr:hypothetical protein [Bacteroidota bacterium]
MKKRYFIFFLMAAWLITGCADKTDPYTTDTDDIKYFPLKTGYTWIYESDSIIYDNKGTKIDSVHHIIREKITGSFTDNEGLKNYVIERSIKTNS